MSSGHYPYHKDIHPSLLYGTLPARGSTVLLARVADAEVEVDRRSTDRVHGVSCSYREIAVTGVILPYFLTFVNLGLFPGVYPSGRAVVAVCFHYNTWG